MNNFYRKALSLEVVLKRKTDKGQCEEEKKRVMLSNSNNALPLSFKYYIEKIEIKEK